MFLKVLMAFININYLSMLWCPESYFSCINEDHIYIMVVDLEIDTLARLVMPRYGMVCGRLHSRATRLQASVLSTSVDERKSLQLQHFLVCQELKMNKKGAVSVATAIESISSIKIHLHTSRQLLH